MLTDITFNRSTSVQFEFCAIFCIIVCLFFLFVGTTNAKCVLKIVEFTVTEDGTVS